MSDLLGTVAEIGSFGLYDHESAGESAAKASTEAARVQAGSQSEAARIEAASKREALDYMIERERLPRKYSEAALTGIGELYGDSGGEKQQQLIDKAIQSPLYKAMIGGKEAGEDAILRSAAATGGFRSGDTQSNLYGYNTQLQNKALLESYNQQLSGLHGLAGLPSNANAIAGGISGIGQTLGAGVSGAGKSLAMGQIAGAQAMQQGQQTQDSQLMSLASMIGSYYFSDRRLKKNIEKIGEFGGHNWYKWDWNVVANKMGLNGQSEGVLADEVVETNPDCIGMKDGFMMVDYKKLGIFGEVAHG